MSTNKKLYLEVIQITEEYLGPAGKRFIDRQMLNHLGKEPGEISKNELVSLSQWMRLTFALLTNDQNMLNEYISRIDGIKANGSTG